MSGRVTRYKCRKKEHSTPQMFFLKPNEETTKWWMLWFLCAVSWNENSISSPVQGQLPYITKFNPAHQDWVMKVTFNEHRLYQKRRPWNENTRSGCKRNGELHFQFILCFQKADHQVFNGCYKLPLAEENIYFFHTCCKTLFPTGNVLRKHLATRMLKQLQCLPLYTRWWCKYTVSGKTTEVLNASHRTIILPVRLVQFNSTPESYISKQ